MRSAKLTGIWRCLVCGGSGTAKTIHCGEQTVFEPPRKESLS